MTLESSAHTSVQTRIKTLATHEIDQKSNEQDPPADAFLSPLTTNEQTDPIGPVPSQTGKRCSVSVRLTAVEFIGVLGDLAASDASAGRPILAPSDAPRQAPNDAIGYCEARCQAETDPTRHSLPAPQLRTD
jgi:hypothetical protein